MSKIIAYYRVSTARQKQAGLGLAAQKASVESYARSCGARIVAEFTEAESGKLASRPQLEAAVRQAKRERAKLVIAKLDRLSRNVSFVATLMESGVDFVAADMPDANRLTIHILAAVAEHEARCIGERTKTALAAAKRRGTLLGASRPECRNLTMAARKRGAAATRARAIADYAELIPVVRQRHEDGDTLSEIAGWLNAEGHTTRTGAAWQATQVWRLLRRSA